MDSTAVTFGGLVPYLYYDDVAEMLDWYRASSGGSNASGGRRTARSRTQT